VPFEDGAVAYDKPPFSPLQEKGGTLRLDVQPVPAGCHVKPEGRDMPALQYHLVAPVQACDLVEQDYPVLEKAGIAEVLQEQLCEQVACGAGGEADISRRRELHPPARLAAGGALAGDEWQAAAVAPEQLALCWSECLGHGSQFNRVQSGVRSI